MLKTVPPFATRHTPLTFPASHKRYISGSRPEMRVPYREVSLSPTRHGDRVEENPPLPIYDNSGPYTDPEANVDLARGLPDLRTAWIEERKDTESLTGPSSVYGRQRREDLLTLNSRFPSRPKLRRARRGQNVSQMHYARKGIVTPEMEFVALRESMQLDRLLQDPAYALLMRQHSGQPLGARLPELITPEFVCTEVAAGRAIIPANINHTELEPMIYWAMVLSAQSALRIAQSVLIAGGETHVCHRERSTAAPAGTTNVSCAVAAALAVNSIRGGPQRRICSADNL